MNRILSGFICAIFFALTNCNIKEEPVLEWFKIEGVSPIHAIPGEEIRILGEGFGTNIQSYIPKLGNRNIEVKTVEDSLLVLQIPEDFIIGNYILSLNRDGFREYSRLYEIKNKPAPQVIRITPFGPEPGETITIYGKNFGLKDSDNGIFFTDVNQHPILFTEEESPIAPYTPLLFSSPDSIQVTVPERAYGNLVLISIDPIGDGVEKYNITIRYK